MAGIAINIIIAILMIQNCCNINALHLTDISVPEVIDFRQTATLSCSYNMGSHALNSVKWYKDGMEFFRYTPMMYPMYMNFKVDGVQLADQTYSCNSNKCGVTLEQLSPSSSGTYRCEISGDSPEFKLVSESANMSVAALPQYDPEIRGLKQSYSFDDFITVNCTSDKSSPPATLNWYINEIKAPEDFLLPQQETIVRSDLYKMYYRSLEIHFQVDKARFGNVKQLHLRCKASIENFPSLTREKNARIFIISTDDLTNQKLVNSRNTGTALNKLQTVFNIYSLVVIFIIMHFF